MRVLVIGCGIIGLTTAYFLRRDGHDVTVIDREEGPGLATSFANGALLTPSMPEPWNTPGSWRVLLGSILRSDSPLQLRLNALPQLTGWGLRFLRNSAQATYYRNTIKNLRLALHSVDVMESLRQHTRVDYERSAKGSLRIFRDSTALDVADAWAGTLANHGLTYRRLSSGAAIALEAALAPIANELVGAIHYSTDEMGDAHKFCRALAEHARLLGIDFCFRTEVSAFEIQSGRISAVLSRQKRFIADRYVMAAGSHSRPLCKSIGIALPVRPAKGYSVTFDNDSCGVSLSMPIIDDTLHAVVVPLDGRVRAAGTAEFAGFDLTIDPNRIRNLLIFLSRVLPQGRFNPNEANPWCGLRPLSADGVPIIGATPIPNLFVNTGHGHLGWTMAAGSAHLLAQIVSGTQPGLDPRPYLLSRFD